MEGFCVWFSGRKRKTRLDTRKRIESDIKLEEFFHLTYSSKMGFVLQNTSDS